MIFILLVALAQGGRERDDEREAVEQSSPHRVGLVGDRPGSASFCCHRRRHLIHPDLLARC